MNDTTATPGASADPTVASIETMVANALAQLSALKPATRTVLPDTLVSRYEMARTAAAEAVARSEHACELSRAEKGAGTRETFRPHIDQQALSATVGDMQRKLTALIAAIETTARPTRDGWARLDARIPLAEHPVFAPALRTAQRRARARTSTGADLARAIKDVIEAVDARLFAKDQGGIVWTINTHAQAFPSTYRGNPESTQVHLRKGRKGWEARPFRDRCKESRIRISVVNPETLGKALAVHFMNTATWN